MKDNLYVLILLAMVGTAVLVAFFVLLQVQSQNKLLRQKRALQEAEIAHQKQLLEAVITSQEAERKRIGMDLHDEVGAALSTLRIRIDRYSSADETTRLFSQTCKSDIDLIMDNMRGIAHSLSPKISGNFGFYDAVHELSDSVNRAGNIEMSVNFDEHRMPVFRNDQAAMALYRVLSELIANTMKHASASKIRLEAEVTPDMMQLLYYDDGCGLSSGNPTTNGIGLRNIESRLGMIGATWYMQPPSTGGYGMKIILPLK